MSRIVPLSNVEHAELRVDTRAGATDAVNQAAILPAEFEAAGRDFPLFVRRTAGGDVQAVALLGLDRDENLWLADERWTSRYVPAAHRRGPFLIGVSGTDPEAPPTIQLDLDDPRIGNFGQPLFLPHGGTTPYLDQVGQALRTIHAGEADARRLYRAWEEARLLTPVELDIELDERTRYRVPDLLTIDEEALAQLDGATLARLSAAGQLRPAFALLASAANVAELIARKNRRREAA